MLRRLEPNETHVKAAAGCGHGRYARRMIWGLLCAVLAAVCFGVGSVLQAGGGPGGSPFRTGGHPAPGRHGGGGLAVGAVPAGLALLGVSAGSEGSVHAGTRFQWALLGCGLALGVAGMLAGRIKGRAGSVLLGLIAGLGFGVVALSAR